MRSNRRILVIALAVAPLLFSYALAFSAENPNSAEEIYKAFGVQKFSEPVKAPDLFITNLEGQKFTLKDFQGKVVFLSFFTVD